MKELMYIGASWCPQCKILRPKVEEWCSEVGLKMEYVDAEADDERMVALNIRNLPALILWDGEEIVCRGVGFDGFEKIKEAYGKAGV